MANKLGKSAAILTLSKVFTLIITMISAMLLARFRTLTEYGTYSQLLLVINLATAFFTLGLPNSTNYFLARAESSEERRQFLSVYFTISTILCFIMGAVLTVLVPLFITYFENPLIKSFAYFLFFYPWAYVTIGSVSNILVVYGKTINLLFFNLISAIISLAAVAFVQVFHGTFNSYMVVFLVSNIILTLSVYCIVWKLEHPLRFSIDKLLVIKIFKYSIPIGLASLVGTVSIEIDKLMIGRFFDTEQLAIYTNAAKELPLTIVATSLTAVLLPQLARMLKKNDSEGAIRIWGISIRLSYLLICFFAMILIVFAPQIMTILYSEKYLPGVAVFRVYSLVLLLRCTYFGIILNSIGKTKMILYSSILSLVLNIILNYLLFLAMGMLGPAIATFISMGIAGFAQVFVTSKELQIPFKTILPWKKLGIITLINLALGIVLYIITKILSMGTSGKDILISIVIGLCGTGLYFIILYKPAKLLWKELNCVE